MKKIGGKILIILNIVAAAALLLSYSAPLINPAKLVFPAFFGLAYPYLLLLNFAFLLYWIIRMKKYMLISLVVILLGWNHLQNLIPVRMKRAAQADSTASSIKFMSYNVRTFDLYNWSREKNTKDGIFQLIADEDPAVVCLQEFYTSSRSGFRENDIRDKLSDYPHDYIYYGFQSGQNRGFGIATFSKYPILATSRIPFNQTFNQAVFTDILRDKDTMRVFNIHLQSIRFGQRNYEFLDSMSLKYGNRQLEEMMRISNQLSAAYKMRAEQAKIIRRYIESSPYPVVICGDFNDTPVSFAYRQIRKSLVDAFRVSGKGFGNTYAGDMPSFRIDYILHSEVFTSTSFQRIKSAHSDHFPIVATLLKEEPVPR